jgi:hypothetical protein
MIITKHEQIGGGFRVDSRSVTFNICYVYLQRKKQLKREIITDQYVSCTTPLSILIAAR